MIILLGSRALQHYGWNEREPKDTDLLGDYDELQEYCHNRSLVKLIASYPINEGKKWIWKYPLNNIFEGELAWLGSLSEELYQLILKNHLSKQNGLIIPELNILYLLKMSHRYLKNSPHFLKTMRDIQWMRKRGATIPTDLLDIYKRRERQTYDYSHPSLMRSKSNFFSGDGVTYEYDHDSIHDAVAIQGRPVYKEYQQDGQEVACDIAKWDALDQTQRLNGVLEEVYVLALERSQIPYAGKVDPKASFDMALMKVCTSITSGWFREFAWEHYDDIQKLYDSAYTCNFWCKVATGKVKKYGM